MEERIVEVNDGASESYKEAMREWMSQGYQEMAQLNSEIANDSVWAENEAEQTTENFLK